MSEFLKKHPAVTEIGDMILSIFSGSFSIDAVATVKIREFIKQKKL